MSEAMEREFNLDDAIVGQGVGKAFIPDAKDIANGLVVSEDGRLLSWQGVNYIKQETVPEEMTNRELLIELVTLARGAVADMAEFSSKIAGNSILSKIFGVKSDKG